VGVKKRGKGGRSVGRRGAKRDAPPPAPRTSPGGTGGAAAPGPRKLGALSDIGLVYITQKISS
jgi:hypothetical protein